MNICKPVTGRVSAPLGWLAICERLHGCGDPWVDTFLIIAKAPTVREEPLKGVSLCLSKKLESNPK